MGLKGVDVPLWDTEIIPAGKFIKKMHLFTNPVGMNFQFRLKDFAIGFNVAEVGSEVSDEILGGTMSFIMGMNKVVQVARLELFNLIYYTDKFCLKDANKRIRSNGIICEIHSQESYRVEIEWDAGLNLIKPISLSVFLLGEYKCSPVDYPQLFCECRHCREQYDIENEKNGKEDK